MKIEYIIHTDTHRHIDIYTYKEQKKKKKKKRVIYMCIYIGKEEITEQK